MKNHQLKSSLQSFQNLNRKLHIHLGLFVLLFVWLFSVSGLILNHGEWDFPKFYETRKESKTEFIVPEISLKDNPELISKVTDQLKIAGEVGNVKTKPGSIDFRVSSPGLVHEIHIDPKSGRGTLKIMEFNFWGKLHTLHMFNGMNKNDPEKSPQWIVAKLWRMMMDMIAVILIILCIGSWIMWFRVRRDYRWGYVVFAMGFLASVYYLFLVDLI